MIKTNRSAANRPAAKKIIFAVVSILGFTLLSGCAGAAPHSAEIITPTAPVIESTDAPTQAAAVVETRQAEVTPSALDVSALIPMYQVGHTSELTEEDMLPELDITTNAETIMREARFGGDLDLVVKFIFKYLNKDTSINEHTFLPVYALNTISNPPVYAAFIYDRQADCLRYPYFFTEPLKDNPDYRQFVFAHSGDVTEIVDLAAANNAFIYYSCLTPPVGLGDGVTIRLIATRTGIVPGAFYNESMFVGWFDFEKRIWHLTDEARGWLEILNSGKDLNANLTAWLSGETVIPESDIFDNGSRSHKFNMFDPAQNYDSRFSQYYGVLLGTQVIDEQLFIFMGFEDVNAKRYYLPFNLGKTSNSWNCGITAVTSNVGAQNQNAGDQSSRYLCKDFGQVLSIFINKPLAVGQFTGKTDDLIKTMIGADQVAAYDAQQEYAVSVSSLIYNSAYSSIGNITFDGRVNAAPDAIDPVDYPPSFIYKILVQKVDY